MRSIACPAVFGEGVRPETTSAIRALALQDSHVREAASPLSMYLGPDEILLTLDVEFERDSTADEIVRAIARIETEIRQRYPKVIRIYIEARSISSAARQGADSATPADVGRPAIADPP